MKKFYFSALALFLGASFTLNAQAPPPNATFENGGFENWTTGSPDGWTDAASLISAGGGTLTPATPTSQGTTGATEGTSYIRIETYDLADSPLPSDFPNGTTGGFVQQEFSSTDKYSSISMDVSYDIQGSDIGMIYIEAKDAGGASVGLVNHELSGSESTFGSIDIPMTYTGTPAVYTIILASSEVAVFGAHPGVAAAELGSWIAVDNISLNIADPDVPDISNIVAADIADNGDGTDLHLTFTVPADESNIDSYVLLAFDSQYGPSNSGTPTALFDPTLGAVSLTPNGADQSYTFTATDTYLSVVNSTFTPVAIVEDQEMVVYVLVKAKSGYTSLIKASNKITLTSELSLTENTLTANVYPNPATNVVNFNVDGLENGTVTITSVTGQEVVNTLFNGSKKVDVSSLENGIYIYSIRNQEGAIVKTSKLVIQ